ncbi:MULTISPECIES: hypothetical protein [unclassified Tolypothrix]|uniref:hypothetical protein n=1 Tax=unclassified Tolypothrix TaxID=2649714 RepID=UPI0005EAB803|nr:MULTISPECIES: hypothetical protein [unclassified Tolypothrix]BAY95258.1 hypothetical protein NIES3275_73150 [Microchaete diplosiphon NIES-3275]EKE98119.1 hypothetical protein FDUTEX481_04266 [Tolypothrix sp. PCC 7601]MBE9085994.1 hypothetical protein [Tolypothrix sp. LEGE 11397]UYD30483.1 hypothetical protein HGR01_37235 [Tolypothrix sp. PCC 7712]UYD38383.1 hypothetical protein HG267_37660 [Tolypothrix sp. PCC 7601]
MATNSNNRPWNLESFLDSLIYELDKAQDTLSVKGMNRKLTYTVKDVSLDLQIFPEFDGETVRFVTAQPGQTGASKVTFQLGTIRDHQIQEVARRPLTRNDISLEEVNLPEPEKKELKKLGIRSAEDLRRTVEEENVDIAKVTDNKVDYQGLANLMNQSRRQQLAPTVSKASLSQSQGKTILTLEGNNLAIAQSLDEFPVAAINNEPVEVISANDKEVKIQVNHQHLQGGVSQLHVALDPYAIVTMNLQLANAAPASQNPNHQPN